MDLLKARCLVTVATFRDVLGWGSGKTSSSYHCSRLRPGRAPCPCAFFYCSWEAWQSLRRIYVRRLDWGCCPKSHESILRQALGLARTGRMLLVTLYQYVLKLSSETSMSKINLTWNSTVARIPFGANRCPRPRQGLVLHFPSTFSADDATPSTDNWREIAKCCALYRFTVELSTRLSSPLHSSLVLVLKSCKCSLVMLFI